MKVSDILADINSSLEPSYEQLESLAQIISAHCKPFLALIDYDPAQHVMWRGVGGADSPRRAIPVFVKEVRTNRKPSTMTNATVHKHTDEYFLRKHNIRAQSQAMFVTGDTTQAATYGNVYAVFPIGEMQFVWSPKVADMDGIFVGQTERKVLELDKTDPQKAFSFVSSILEKQKYTTQDLKGALSHGVEIMVNCDFFLSISQSLFNQMKEQGLFDYMDS